MSKRPSLFFVCLLLVCAAAMPASAQKASQTPKPAATPSSEEDQEPQPEPPKKVLRVDIKNGLLTVDLENVDFGVVIKAVADKAGFKIEGSGEVFSRMLNTRFANVEVERGVLRLLTLVKESNYLLSYDTKGQISKLEILGISSGKAPLATTRQPFRTTPALRRPAVSPEQPQAQMPAPVSPVPQTRPIRPLTRRRPVISRPVSPSQPANQLPATAMPPIVQESIEEEAQVEEIPYVAPQPKQAPVQGK